MTQANTVEEGHKVRGARREVRGQREIQEMSTRDIDRDKAGYDERCAVFNNAS